MAVFGGEGGGKSGGLVGGGGLGGERVKKAIGVGVVRERGWGEGGKKGKRDDPDGVWIKKK